MTDTPTSTRICGQCTACCLILGVVELNKPAHTKCSHCTPGAGCGIYDTRPKECADFQCGWIQGFGDEEDRPDRLHAVLVNTTPVKAAGGTLAFVFHLDYRGWQRPSARLCGIRDAIVKSGAICIWVHGTHARRVFGPPAVMHQLRAFFAEQNAAVEEIDPAASAFSLVKRDQST